MWSLLHFLGGYLIVISRNGLLRDLSGVAGVGDGEEGTSLSGSVSTTLTVWSWIRMSIRMCGALPSPVCA